MSILKPTATGLEVTGNSTLDVTVNLNATAPTDDISGTVTRSVGADGVATIDLIDGIGAGPQYIMRRANGTNGAKTGLITGNAIAIISARGYGATTYSGNRAQFRLVASENWTDSAQGTHAEISTTPIGTATAVSSFSVNDIGVRSNRVGANVASAGTITPTGPVFHVTGAVAIATINVPTNTLPSPMITIIPDGAFTWTTAGNIALAGTAVVSKALSFYYDSGTTKWYPSYV